MTSNKDKITNFYSGGGEDNRASSSLSTELEFRYTKKFLSKYINDTSRVIEIGCATGYYGMFFADKCAEYVGVDITPENIDIFNKKIADNGLTNVTAAVGDAMNLSEYEDCSFDVVLCLGPMYHLPQEERTKVFDECRRIACDGAVLAFAYINRLGVYLACCVHDEFRTTLPDKNANEYVFKHDTDPSKPGVFYFTSPEEMEHDAKLAKLDVLKNYGLDYFIASCAIEAMTEEQFECYLEIADRMCENPSCVGLSNHALLVCKK